MIFFGEFIQHRFYIGIEYTRVIKPHSTPVEWEAFSHFTDEETEMAELRLSPLPSFCFCPSFWPVIGRV